MIKITQKNMAGISVSKICIPFSGGGGVNWAQYWATLIRNSDIVEAGGYQPVIEAAGNLNLALPARTFIFKNNLLRIRQSGNITKVHFYISQSNLSTCTAFYIQIWRQDGATYDLVGEEDVRDRIIGASLNTITLNSPISVLEGDFVAINGTGVDAIYFNGANVTTANSLRYYDGARPVGNDYDWDAVASLSYTIPVKVYMQAPFLVAIGDSIVSGANGNTSFTQNALEYSVTSQITHQLSLIDAKYVCQNMGIGGQVSDNIVARFTADVIDLKPKAVYIHIGVNDISIGTETKAGYLANFTTMLDACVTAGIIPIVGKVLPWTAGTNGQMQTRDDWMADLETLVKSYTGNTRGIWVDFDAAMGKNRVGGDAGNLWDLQTTPDYNDDNVHPTILGYAKMAEVINAAILAG